MSVKIQAEYLRIRPEQILKSDVSSFWPVSVGLPQVYGAKKDLHQEFLPDKRVNPVFIELRSGLFY